MPAIITHDTFGRETYDELHSLIGNSRDEADAFLLGNQGPDPLFYSVADPRLRSVHRLGSRMHRECPSELLAALKRSITVLDERDRSIGRAYALGFLCHYLLDSTMHPFVHWQEYEACDAGEPGLDRSDSSEVHAVIERELDELVLFTKHGETVATFDPSREILRASNHVLSVISKMYAYVAMTVFGFAIPKDTFEASVKSFRRVQALFHSKNGFKREALARAEELVRRYSFYRSMSHRAVALEESIFDNRARTPWKDPFTGETSTDSFWDRYDAARARTKTALEKFAHDGFDMEAARAITDDLNFSGEPTCATIVAVEDGDGAARAASATEGDSATRAASAAEAAATPPR